MFIYLFISTFICTYICISVYLYVHIFVICIWGGEPLPSGACQQCLLNKDLIAKAGIFVQNKTRQSLLIAPYLYQLFISFIWRWPGDNTLRLEGGRREDHSWLGGRRAAHCLLGGDRGQCLLGGGGTRSRCFLGGDLGSWRMGGTCAESPVPSVASEELTTGKRWGSLALVMQVL